MKNIKRVAVAVVAVVAAAGFSGCASTRVAELARADGAAPAAEPLVIRALPSYGSMGGYRYRRFAVVAGTS